MTIGCACREILGFGLLFGAGIALQADALQEAIAKAPPLEVEKVTAPVTDTSGGGITWVPNVKTGSWNLLIHYFRQYTVDNRLVMIDLATGAVNTRHFERGQIGTRGGVVIAPNGKAYTNTDGGTMVFDPEVNDIRFLEGSSLNGETKPMTLAPDGKIYGTASSGAQAIVYGIDPATDTFTSYGPIGPSYGSNPCWGYSVAADARYVYVVSGKNPWRLLAYDRETAKTEVLITHDDPEGIIMIGRDYHHLAGSVRYGDKKKPWLQFWLHEGKVVPRDPGVSPTIPALPTATVPAPARPVLKGATLPTTNDGLVELWVDSSGKSSVAPSEEAGWKRIRFNVPVYPASLYQLAALPDGRIAGCAGNYLGIFIYDPSTGSVVRTQKLGASTPVMTTQGSILYASDYPRALTFAIDTTAPLGSNNPRTLGSLGNEGSGIHRTLAITTAADGKIYFCGGWQRNGEGGGLGWWDPKEGKAGGTHEGMANYRTTHMTTTGGGRYVVLSSRTVEDQQNAIPAPATAKIFVFDTETGKLTSFPTIDGISHTGAVAGADGTRVLAITLAPGPADTPWNERGSVLYAFDAVSGKIEWRKDLPYAIGFLINENYDNTVPFDFRRGPDGMVWTFTGGEQRVVDPERQWGLSYEDARLVRIDPSDGSIHVAGLVGRAGRMAFQGKDLYLTGGGKYHTTDAEYLRRIKGVVK